jgi:predicted transcriptional regulator
MLYQNQQGFPREVVMCAATRLHEQGIRQVAIAQALGCSQGTVSNWLRSKPPHIAESCIAQVDHLVASLESLQQL